MEKFIELAKKLKALADRGTGGEKYNAQRQLEKIMAKHDITMEMLDETEREWVFFEKIPLKYGRLFVQIVSSVLGINFEGGQHRKIKTTRAYKTTKLEEAEVRAKWGFYRRAFDHQYEVFVMAFVQTNGIYADGGEVKKTSELSEAEKKKVREAAMMSMGMNKSVYRRQLA